MNKKAQVKLIVIVIVSVVILTLIVVGQVSQNITNDTKIIGSVVNTGPVDINSEIIFNAQCEGVSSKLVICRENSICNSNTQAQDLLCSSLISDNNEKTCSYVTTQFDEGVHGNDIATCCDAEGLCNANSVWIDSWVVNPPSGSASEEIYQFVTPEEFGIPKIAVKIESPITNNDPVMEGLDIMFTGACLGKNTKLVICKENTICNLQTSKQDIICESGVTDDPTKTCSYTTTQFDLGIHNNDVATCCNDMECDSKTELVDPWTVTEFSAELLLGAEETLFGIQGIPGLVSSISIGVMHPDAVGKDRDGFYGVIIYNPTGSAVTIDRVDYIVDSASFFKEAMCKTDNCFPSMGGPYTQVVSQRHYAWDDGSYSLPAESAIGFYGFAKSNKISGASMTYNVTIGGTVYSVGPYPAHSENANIPFTRLAFDTVDGSDPFRPDTLNVSVDASAVKTYTIALIEDGGRGAVASGSTLTIEMPSFTSLSSNGGTDWGTASIDGTTITVSTTADVLNGVITYSWDATAPASGGLYAINATMSGTNARAVFEGAIKVIGGAPADTEYPIFSNYWDDNASLIDSGTGHFNVTIESTNGTVFLEINGENTTATNLTSNVYNASYVFSIGGNYDYYWGGWGNGTSENYNTSGTRTYTVNETATQIGLELITPTDSWINVTQNQFFNITVNVSCLSGNCGDVNVSFDPESSASSKFAGAAGTAETDWANTANAVGAEDTSCADQTGAEAGPYSAWWKTFAFSIPSSADINGIKVDVGAGGSGDPRTITATVGKSEGTMGTEPGTQAVSNEACGTGQTVYTFGSLTDKWGLSWTASEVNDAGFTVRITPSATAGTILINWINVTVNYTETAKSGLISRTVGDSPFYTNATSNPWNITLGTGESQVLTMWVNATGNLWSNHTFFIYANRTSDMSVSNITSKWNVTIVNVTAEDTTPPTITSALANITNNASYGEFIKINATVTDDTAVSSVTIQYDPPDDSPYNITALVSGSEYYNDTVNLSRVGQWIFIFHANDTSANNATPVTVQDLGGETAINVSAPVTNTAPVISEVSTISDQTITLKSYINVTYTFNATDADGAGDLDNSTAAGQFNLTNEALRTNTTCAATNVNSSTNMYECTIAIWWFDGAGGWTINASIKDSAGEYAEDTSTTFTINPTKGMDMAPTAVSWADINLGDTDIMANSNITLNNTGNVGLTNVNVTGYMLHGTDAGKESQFIYAGNFSVNINWACNSGDDLQNNTQKVVTGATVAKGNYTIDNGTAQEDIGFCLEAVEGAGGGLSPQTYQTLGGYPWEIRVD